ncbi:MAG: hypothetical protein WBL93_11800 [Lutisporaceae bacterium]
MVQYSRKSTLLRLIIMVLLIVIATAAVIAGILIYKGTFNEMNYSNWLFFASMGYIAIGGFSAYGAFMGNNSYSHKYLSSVMSADYDSRKRIDDMLLNSSFSFMMKMIVIGILVLLESVAANLFL